MGILDLSSEKDEFPLTLEPAQDASRCGHKTHIITLCPDCAHRRAHPSKLNEGRAICCNCNAIFDAGPDSQLLALNHAGRRPRRIRENQ